MQDAERLSPWWGRAVAITMVLGFTALVLISATAYRNAPPVPARVVDPAGAVVFTGDDIRHGQSVFLSSGERQRFSPAVPVERARIRNLASEPHPLNQVL